MKISDSTGRRGSDKSDMKRRAESAGPDSADSLKRLETAGLARDGIMTVKAKGEIFI
jgi:hypothetical protein